MKAGSGSPCEVLLATAFPSHPRSKSLEPRESTGNTGLLERIVRLYQPVLAKGTDSASPFTSQATAVKEQWAFFLYADLVFVNFEVFP